MPVREMPENVELCDPCSVSPLSKVWWYARALIRVPLYIYQQRRDWPGHAEIQSVDFIRGFKTSLKALFVSIAVRHYAKSADLPRGATGYAYWRDFSAAAMLLSKYALGLGKVYVRAHRVDIYSSLRWPNESVIHRHADRIYPVSEDGCNYLRDVKGLVEPVIDVRRLGVRLPECVTEPSSDGILRILTCSNIVPVKRVELIAKVIAELPGEVEWTHIGDGDGIDSIKSYVEAVFDHSHRANFVGRLANAEVYEYYQNHLVDLFMNLSESEGVPVSIMEALVHGVPVVATDVGGTAEIVDETIGCVLPIDVSARDACEAVLKLGLGTESSIRLRENARARGEERCSSQSNYSVFCGELSE